MFKAELSATRAEAGVAPALVKKQQSKMLHCNNKTLVFNWRQIQSHRKTMAISIWDGNQQTAAYPVDATMAEGNFEGPRRAIGCSC